MPIDIKLLKQRRKELKLTQADVARKLRVTRSAYTNKELGRYEFTSTELEILTNLLRVSFNDLFKSKEPAKYTVCSKLVWVVQK